MIKHSALILAVVAGGALHSAPAEALVTTYTDRAAFQSAAGTTVLEDFNGFTEDISFSGGGVVDVGDFTLSGTSVFIPSALNMIDAPPDSGFSINGTSFVSAVTNSNDSLTIEFASAISAFGADFSYISNSPASITSIDWGLGEPAIEIPALRPGFFGFVSDTEFSTLTFTSNGIDTWSMDNIEYALVENIGDDPMDNGEDDPTEIPEPGMLVGLAALGLLGVATRKRS
ncbi:MAG: PEP-CTERM sorting domain-containing protein [Cyanobacteria bacterium P01_G01_bin.54]